MGYHAHGRPSCRDTLECCTCRVQSRLRCQLQVYGWRAEKAQTSAFPTKPKGQADQSNKHPDKVVRQLDRKLKWHETQSEANSMKWTSQSKTESTQQQNKRPQILWPRSRFLHSMLHSSCDMHPMHVANTCAYWRCAGILWKPPSPIQSQRSKFKDHLRSLRFAQVTVFACNFCGMQYSTFEAGLDWKQDLNTIFSYLLYGEGHSS